MPAAQQLSRWSCGRSYMMHVGLRVGLMQLLLCCRHCPCYHCAAAAALLLPLSLPRPALLLLLLPAAASCSGPLELHYDLLIGADGSGSSVRDALAAAVPSFKVRATSIQGRDLWLCCASYKCMMCLQ